MVKPSRQHVGARCVSTPVAKVDLGICSRGAAQTLGVVLSGLLLLSNGALSWANPPATKTQPGQKPAAVVKSAPAAKTTIPKPEPAPKEEKITPAAVISVSPLVLVQNPKNYLNKSIQFEATFNSFSSLGLDYKKALRDSKDHVGVLIRRPDVEHHVIPLSELKLFLSRKDSDAVAKLETGDRVRITGKVFSTALEEPWVDITEMTILSTAKSGANKPAKAAASTPGQAPNDKTPAAAGKPLGKQPVHPPKKK